MSGNDVRVRDLHSLVESRDSWTTRTLGGNGGSGFDGIVQHDGLTTFDEKVVGSKNNDDE